MHRRALLCATGGAALDALVPRPVLGAGLTPEEEWRLAADNPIRVPLDLDLPQGSYFGGLVYQRVDATVDEVMTIAGDPGSYTSILYATREGRVLSRSGRDMQVYLRQDLGGISVSYVMLVRREAANLIRFWLDPSQPHDLDDGWGFLRAEPWSEPPWFARWKPPRRQSVIVPEPHTVITWGLLLRIDATPLKLHYSEEIRRYAMATPDKIAGTVIARRRGRSI
jgi:hypothetical protein